jgi:hypothetical protein
MAKGYDANRERQDSVASMGKILGKRARFSCEWCGGKGDLRPWDHRPELEPAPETVALLCSRCRDLAGGKPADGNEMRVLRNALWSDIPAVAEGVAKVLLRSKEPWVREAVDESLIDEDVKRKLLG